METPWSLRELMSGRTGRECRRCYLFSFRIWQCRCWLRNNRRPCGDVGQRAAPAPSCGFADGKASGAKGRAAISPLRRPSWIVRSNPQRSFSVGISLPSHAVQTRRAPV